VYGRISKKEDDRLRKFQSEPGQEVGSLSCRGIS